MSYIQPVLRMEIQPTVKDVCAVISAVSVYYPGAEEEHYLAGIKEALDKRLAEIEKAKEPSPGIAYLKAEQVDNSSKPL